MDATKEVVTVDGDKLIEAIGVEEARKILGVLDIRLSQVHWDRVGLISVSREWHESTEGRWWAIEMRQLPLSASYSVRWSVTDEAGIDDVAIVQHSGDADQDTADVAECLESLCFDLGDGQVRAAK